MCSMPGWQSFSSSVPERHSSAVQAQPGKIQRGQRAQNCQNHLHQLHACLPSRPGHTRLLYRMSMDFIGWARMVPGIQRFWQHIAGQVSATLGPIYSKGACNLARAAPFGLT